MCVRVHTDSIYWQLTQTRTASCMCIYSSLLLSLPLTCSLSLSLALPIFAFLSLSLSLSPFSPPAAYARARPGLCPILVGTLALMMIETTNVSPQTQLQPQYQMQPHLEQQQLLPRAARQESWDVLGKCLTLILNLYLVGELKACETCVVWVNGLLLLLLGWPRLTGHLVCHFSFRLPSFSFLPLIRFDDGLLIGVSLAGLAGNDRWHSE